MTVKYTSVYIKTIKRKKGFKKKHHGKNKQINQIKLSRD
jgi:hypothetical protein